MLFTLVIHSGPYSQTSSTSLNALNFAKALLKEGHTIHRLFFYGDGVFNLNAQMVTPQGEIDLPKAWHTLIEDHSIDSVVCIAAGARRGVLNDSEAKRHQKDSGNLLGSSDLSGLGQLIEAAATSERVITFG